MTSSQNRVLHLTITQQTQSSHRARGIHDVREEITWEGRPDLIVHDSGGFEAGTDNEFHAIEDFLKEKSAAEDILDQVHVIWFCIDINSPRTLQSATEKLFLAVSTYAKDVPIVVVATKKDDLLDVSLFER
jgi:GTPase SAR1 family protein